MSAMMPLMRVLEQGGKFIQCIKHGCEMMGQYAGPPRPPLKALNKDDKRQLEQVVTRAQTHRGGHRRRRADAPRQTEAAE